MSEPSKLLAEIRRCTLCEGLPLGPRPIVQLDARARILIAGQAPGRLTHAKGVPFDDPSGERLRDWLGVDRATFYDASKFAVVPMGFCFPGSGKSGDLPPRPECAERWREPVLEALPAVALTLVLGRHAMAWHLGLERRATLTSVVEGWRARWPEQLPLPHPSPRNRRWFAKNPWFEAEVLPALRGRVAELLGSG